MSTSPSKTIIFDENEVSTEKFAKTNQEIFTALQHRCREIPVAPLQNPYAHVMQRFAESVSGKERPVADGTDGLKEVQLANAIYVSGWEEKRVQVPVQEQRYLDGLRRRQKEEREGR